MRQSIHESINTEVEQYRRTLVHFAKAREWESFEKKAGVLFDYLESIELTILERKFYSAFIMILAISVGIVIVILKADNRFLPMITRYKEYVVLLASFTTFYELYFYLNYRSYVQVKMLQYKKRKEQFIRNIENDFKEYTMGSGV